MAVKKSELYSSLWASCDALRGGMDASQYKDYILTLLFVKYVSDKFTGEDYADIEIPEGGSFDDMVKLIGKKNIGEGTIRSLQSWPKPTICAVLSIRYLLMTRINWARTRKW